MSNFEVTFENAAGVQRNVTVAYDADELVLRELLESDGPRVLVPLVGAAQAQLPLGEAHNWTPTWVTLPDGTDVNV